MSNSEKPVDRKYGDKVRLYIAPKQLVAYIEVDEHEGWPTADEVRVAMEGAAGYGYFPQDPTGDDKSTSEFVGEGDTFRTRYHLTKSAFGYELQNDDEPERALRTWFGKGDDGLAGVGS